MSLAFAIVGLSACSSFSPSTDDAQAVRFDELAALFANANVLSEPKIVDCALSGGTETKCFSAPKHSSG